MKTFIHGLTFLLFIPLLFENTFAQDWDYEKYPQVNIELNHLKADIRIQEDGTIEGDILYSARVLHHETDKIELDAARLTIHSVVVNDRVKNHRFEDHKLIIELDNPLRRGEEVKIQIVYDTVPSFGIHLSESGTMFTSQLPKTTQHWLPVIDHPLAEFTTEFSFTHPTGYTIVSPGVRGSSELLNVDEETVTFRSVQPIPATAIAWVLGNFHQTISTTDSEQGLDGVEFSTYRSFRDSENIRIHFYFESESELSEVTEAALTGYMEIKNQLRLADIYSDLHIVVLDDNFWETRNYAAGVVFVYKNSAEPEVQVKRGILSQWFGVQVRERQWDNSDGILAIQSLLSNKLFSFDLTEGEVNHPYDAFSPENFSRWMHFFMNRESENFYNDLTFFLLDEGLDAVQKLLSWEDLAVQIYNRTGQPYFSGFTPDAILSEAEEMYHYHVSVEWEEGAATAQVHFEADGSPVDEIVSVTAHEITFTGERTHEITFSGQSESVVINVSSGIENLKFSVNDREDINLRSSKPFMFWLHQMRNSDEISRRVEAARGISDFTDNPDLQLALNDLLQMESNPEVYAEIIRSMGNLTRGASGTDEQFIQNSSVNQSRVVQLAAVEALANYPENQRVIARLRTIINQTEFRDIRQAAIYSLYEVTTVTDFSNAVQNFVTSEAVLNDVPLLLELLAEKGERETAVEIASTFVEPEFSYTTRKGALDIMIRYDQSPANWNERLPKLLSDSDPRIRYHSADALQRLSSQQRSRIISDRIDDEFDARVRQKLQ